MAVALLSLSAITGSLAQTENDPAKYEAMQMALSKARELLDSGNAKGALAALKPTIGYASPTTVELMAEATATVNDPAAVDWAVTAYRLKGYKATLEGLNFITDALIAKNGGSDEEANAFIHFFNTGQGDNPVKTAKPIPGLHIVWAHNSSQRFTALGDDIGALKAALRNLMESRKYYAKVKALANSDDPAEVESANANMDNAKFVYDGAVYEMAAVLRNIDWSVTTRANPYILHMNGKGPKPSIPELK